MHKKRGYKRDTPLELLRDYKLFAIACEGGKREPNYFKVFEYMSRKVKVDIINNIVSDIEISIVDQNKSAPKWVLDRAVRYIEKEGLNEDDELWFVIDVDKWSEQQLREIASYCEAKQNWNIVLSNPCFEVWLYFHKANDLQTSKSKTCQDLKMEISKLEKGGYHEYKFIPLIQDAILNAKNADSDPKHFFPKHKETKMYKVAESILKVVGKKNFADFLTHELPRLIDLDIQKSKISKRRLK